MPNETLEPLIKEVLGEVRAVKEHLGFQDRTLQKVDLTVNGDGNGNRGLVRKVDGVMRDISLAKWLLSAILIALLGALADRLVANHATPHAPTASTSSNGIIVAASK